MITRSAIADSGTFGHTKPTPMYGNSEGQKIHGVEIEFSHQPSSDLFMFSNLSYKTGIEKATNDDIAFLAKVTANLGFNWKLSQKLGLGAYLQYIGKREGNLNNGLKITIDPYTLVNIKLGYEISPSVKLSLICKNALNKKYQHPEYIRKKIASIPGGPERAFYLKIQTELR